jgi:hypothetical protein
LTDETGIVFQKKRLCIHEQPTVELIEIALGDEDKRGCHDYFVVATEHLLENTPGASSMKSPSALDSGRQIWVLCQKFW